MKFAIVPLLAFLCSHSHRVLAVASSPDNEQPPLAESDEIDYMSASLDDLSLRYRDENKKQHKILVEMALDLSNTIPPSDIVTMTRQLSEAIKYAGNNRGQLSGALVDSVHKIIGPWYNEWIGKYKNVLRARLDMMCRVQFALARETGVHLSDAEKATAKAREALQSVLGLLQQPIYADYTIFVADDWPGIGSDPGGVCSNLIVLRREFLENADMPELYYVIGHLVFHAQVDPPFALPAVPIFNRYVLGLEDAAFDDMVMVMWAFLFERPATLGGVPCLCRLVGGPASFYRHMIQYGRHGKLETNPFHIDRGPAEILTGVMRLSIKSCGAGSDDEGVEKFRKEHFRPDS